MHFLSQCEPLELQLHGPRSKGQTGLQSLSRLLVLTPCQHFVAAVAAMMEGQIMLLLARWHQEDASLVDEDEDPTPHFPG